MSEQPLTEKQIAALQRMADHLPKGDDLVMLVLKGHLLMEERLFKMLEGSTPHPEFVAKAGLRTAQLISLTKAMHWSDQYAWLWHMAETLNKLRNQLAHRLEPRDIESLIDEFIRPLKDRIPDAVSAFADTPEGRLRAGICFLYGAVLGH
jgi:hypothetical protein